MSLPSNEHTFEFSEKGEKTKKAFEGSFTVKCLLSIQEIVDVGLRIDSYNRGSITVAPGINLINRAFAELDVRIVKSPSWWKDSNNGRELRDINIVLQVFSKAVDAEDVYEKRIVEAAVEADKSVAKSTAKKKE